MFTEVELMQWIEDFGRWNVLELVAKKQDTLDVITYLRAERSLELAKAAAFVTTDSVRFEREESSNLSLKGIQEVQKTDGDKGFDNGRKGGVGDNGRII